MPVKVAVRNVGCSVTLPPPAQGKKKESKTSMADISRRRLVKGVAAVVAGALAGGKETMAQETKETDPAGEITPADIAASERLGGRRASTETERALMLKSLGGMRDSERAVRLSDAARGQEPAAHFDPRLPSTPLPPATNACIPRAAPAPAYDGNIESLAFAPVVHLARLLKAQTITSVDLTKMYLARLKKFGPRLLCVVELTEQIALVQAARADAEIAGGQYRGPLHGVPYGIKDLFFAVGTRTTYGAAPFRDQHSPYNSTVVSRLEAAGAVLCAKLSMGELAMGDVWFGGTTRNPWKPSTGSSGSSAGSAAATAAGLVGFTIGTETLGSIVSPSRVCGTTGLRPTNGRISRHGAMALCWTMDKVGPICRGVEDCALVFAALHGPDGLDPTALSGVGFAWDGNGRNLAGLRVGYDALAWDALKKSKAKTADATRKMYDDVLAILRGLGATPVPVTLPARTPAYAALADLIIGVEGSASFSELRESGKLSDLAQQDDWNWPNSFRVAATVPAADYIQALRVRTHLQYAMADALKDVDVYVTVPGVGPSLLYTNLTGHPTVITRCGQTDMGLPLSVEFTGNLYREDAALHVAHAYEQATDWHTRWPATDALPEKPPKMS